MFINLSNHRLSTWDEKQMEEAGRYGEIVDMPFPVVPVDASEQWVSDKAAEIFEEIERLTGGDATVMVQGEFTLTFALVDELIAKGYDVVAACSERNVDEKVSANGDVTKSVIYHFAGFRRYKRTGEVQV